MPLAKQDWARTPGAYVFDAVSLLPISVPSVGAAVAITTVLGAPVPLPCAVKVAKVAIAFTAAADLTGDHAVNVVYNTVATPGAGGALGAVAQNDNSYTGPLPGNTGVPTNGAVDGTPLFAANIALTTANFPGATAAGGGIAVFVPNAYDAVYPSGGSGSPADVSGYFTVRAVTPATTGSITNLSLALFVVPITLTQTWYDLSSLTPPAACIPGQSF